MSNNINEKVDSLVKEAEEKVNAQSFDDKLKALCEEYKVELVAVPQLKRRDDGSWSIFAGIHAIPTQS